MNLENTVFRIGSPCADNYGFLILKDCGEVFGYDSQNEHSWGLEDGKIFFVDVKGRVTSRYERCDRWNVWIGRHEKRLYPMYLIPVLEYPSNHGVEHMPPVLINSIPKSGTHFLQQITRNLGFTPGETMFTWDNIVDDFHFEQELDLEETLGSRGKICPINVAIGAIPRGTVAISHLVNPLWHPAQAKTDLKLVHTIRDLRNVIISLYYWKKQPEAAFTSEAFLTFLVADVDGDIDLIMRSAENIIGNGGSQVVRYEHLMDPTKVDEPATILSNLMGQSVHSVKNAIETARDIPTRTFRKNHSNHLNIWNSEIEAYFSDRGLKDLNSRLGYQ